MGFMDKLKEQASAAVDAAKGAAQKGQEKLDEVQAKRAADGVLRQLGLSTFLQKVGRGDGSDADKLVETLQEYEKEYGALSSD